MIIPFANHHVDLRKYWVASLRMTDTRGSDPIKHQKAPFLTQAPGSALRICPVQEDVPAFNRSNKIPPQSNTSFTWAGEKGHDPAVQRVQLLLELLAGLAAERIGDWENPHSNAADFVSDVPEHLQALF